jgi:hypothetical protein
MNGIGIRGELTLNILYINFAEKCDKNERKKDIQEGKRADLKR